MHRHHDGIDVFRLCGPEVLSDGLFKLQRGRIGSLQRRRQEEEKRDEGVFHEFLWLVPNLLFTCTLLFRYDALLEPKRANDRFLIGYDA